MCNFQGILLYRLLQNYSIFWPIFTAKAPTEQNFFGGETGLDTEAG